LLNIATPLTPKSNITTGLLFGGQLNTIILQIAG